jgi:hypothetical protein
MASGEYVDIGKDVYVANNSDSLVCAWCGDMTDLGMSSYCGDCHLLAVNIIKQWWLRCARRLAKDMSMEPRCSNCGKGRRISLWCGNNPVCIACETRLYGPPDPASEYPYDDVNYKCAFCPNYYRRKYLSRANPGLCHGCR